MKYLEFEPKEQLADYIQVIWAMESEHENETYPKSQIMPDGIVEIIFHYRAPFYTYQGSEKFLQPESFAVSMMKQFVEIESSGETGFISVRFFPWGAHHFFDEPVKNFLDQSIDAIKLWGEHTRSVLHDIKEAKTLDEKFKVVERFLLQRLQDYRKEDNSIDKAIQLVRESKGLLTIEEICAQTGYTKKQLERKFLANVGTTPKVFSRISRFLNICKHMDEQENKTLTELTHECGYYDQAHFIREFKAFSGYTPKDFFAKERVFFSDL